MEVELGRKPRQNLLKGDEARQMSRLRAMGLISDGRPDHAQAAEVALTRTCWQAEALLA